MEALFAAMQHKFYVHAVHLFSASPRRSGNPRRTQRVPAAEDTRVFPRHCCQQHTCARDGSLSRHCTPHLDLSQKAAPLALDLQIFS
jgi:hypothetical protein